MNTQTPQIPVKFSVHKPKVVGANWRVMFRVNGKQIGKAIPNTSHYTEGKNNERTVYDLAKPIVYEKFNDVILPDVIEDNKKNSISYLINEYLESRTVSIDTKKTMRKEFNKFFSFINQDINSISIKDVSPDILNKIGVRFDELCRSGECAYKYWANIYFDLFGQGSNQNKIGGLFNYIIKVKKLLPNDFFEQITFTAPNRNLFKTNINSNNVRNYDMYWTEKEFNEVYDELNKKKDNIDGLIFYLLYHTGMDIGDLADLQRQHIVLNGNGVYSIIKHRKKETKSKDAVIKFPLNDILKKLIIDGVYNKINGGDDTLLFPSLNNDMKKSHSLLYMKVWYIWNKLYNKDSDKQIKPKSLKALRHTFITRHIESGESIDNVQDWIGHSKKSTVLKERYLNKSMDNAKIPSLI